MKVKLTKKVLCTVLSLLMVITSLPLTVFGDEEHTHWAEDPQCASAASALSTAIEKYEIKMDGTIYTNMSAAYDAYCAAVKEYDTYQYTKARFSTTDLTNMQDATRALTTATDAMTPWEPGSNIEEAYPSQIDTTEGNKFTDYESPYFNNILYAEPIPTTPSGDVTVSGIKVDIHHGNTVVYYNGDSDPAIVPVSAKSGGNYLYSIYPNQGSGSSRDSVDISLGYQSGKNDFLDSKLGNKTYWIGTWLENAEGFKWGFWHFIEGDRTEDQLRYVGSDYTSGVRSMQSADRSVEAIAVLNGIKINTIANNQYSKVITPTWYVGAGDKPNKTNGFITNDSAKIYVVNYNALTQAVERNSQKLDIGAVNTYAAGGLGDVIQKFDDAINLDINNYNYADNMETAVKNAAQKIQETVEALDSVSSTPDPAEYQALRDAIDSQRLKYEEHYATDLGTPEPLDDVYTNWGDFVAAYDKALTAMNTAINGNYPKDDSLETVKSTADALQTFLLKGEVARVDTTLLQATMDNAQYVIDNQNFFDFTAYNDLLGENYNVDTIKEAIKHAKIAVWGAEDQYPHGRYQLEDNDENFEKVLDEVLAVADTIRDIPVNMNAEVKYADNYSYTTAMSAAEGYINEKEKYSNSVQLLSAYDNAKYFANETNSLHKLSEPGRQNYARDLADEYKEVVLSLYDAINSLVPSFAFNLENVNGTIISSDSEVAPVSLQYTANTSHPYNFAFNRTANNRVFLRTTADKADFDLGDVSMTWSNTTVTNDGRRDEQMLDAVNFNLDTNTSWKLDYTNKGNGGKYFDDRTGSLTADANGADFVVSGIHVISGGNGPGNSFGRHKDSAWLGNDIFEYTTGKNLWDDDLSTVEPNTPNNINTKDYPVGGVFTFQNTTEMRADYTLSLPENTSYSSLTAGTIPTITEYKAEKSLGIVFTFYNTRNTTNRYGQAITNQTPEGTTATYTTTATVIDITPLLLLIQRVNEKLVDTSSYTQSVIDNLNTALSKADDEIDASLNAQQMAEEFQKRYTDLWNACEALNQDSSKRADFDKIISGGKTYSYDDAKYSVLRLLQGLDENNEPSENIYYFKSEAVKEIAKALLPTTEDEAFTGRPRFEYLNSTIEERANVSADNQAKINKEVSEYIKFYNDLINPETKKQADISSYTAALNTVQNLNADAYNIEEIQKVVKENPLPQESISVNGASIVCYDMNKVDGATGNIETAITDNQYPYSVTVIDKDGNTYYLTDKDGNLTEPNSEEGKADFHYGDIVKVKSFDGEKAAFSTTVKANGTDKQTEKRLITTAAEYEFDVRGNTTVYVSATESDEQVVKVTFRDNQDNRIVAVDYATKNEAYDMGKAPVPQFMFYTIKDFTVKDGTNDGAGATVEKNGSYTFNNDTEVIINYEISSLGQTSDKYTVKVLDLNGSDQSEKAYGYNVRVRVTVDGAAAFVDADTYESASPEVIAYGDSYAFYTCQDITLRAVDEAYLTSHNLNENNHQVSVIKTPVIDGNTAQVVGTFAFPENAKPKQYGIVLDASGNNKDSLTLNMVSSTAKIYNFSCSKIIGDNQFAVSVTFGSMPSTFSYVAYVIYHDQATNKDVTVYSPIKTYTKGV